MKIPQQKMQLSSPQYAVVDKGTILLNQKNVEERHEKSYIHTQNLRKSIYLAKLISTRVALPGSLQMVEKLASNLLILA